MIALHTVCCCCTHQIQTQEALFFWTDELEFRAIPSADYRRAKANQLFRKYCLETSAQVRDGQCAAHIFPALLTYCVALVARYNRLAV